MKIAALLYRFKLHHLLFWMLLFAGWYFFRYQDYSSRDKALLITLIKVADLALLVYVTNYFLIPKLLYQKQYLLFALIFISLIAASSFLKISLISYILNPAAELHLFDENLKARIYDNVIPHFLLVSTGAAVKLLFDYGKSQKRLGDMAKEKAEAELTFLKSQMNPHFLFNSLNSVYFLIDKSNTDARNALHKFSEMLRYQLYETRDEKIPIEKEISYMMDYIDLQKLRRNEHSKVEINIDEKVKGFYIEPLLLIPLVENSFKHLSQYTDGSFNYVKINLEKMNGDMNFMIRNTTEGRQHDVIQAGGIGLNNVKRRLQLLYPLKHELEIKESDGWFDVRLKMTVE